ncbi:MAG: DNA/RNA nuclease SfsA [Spirochaetaceae bacterium]|nr:DNA/RNA nuclease SfsA [Spirochaetaceae bacterium]
MLYKKIRKAIFLQRPNRFIAQVEIDGEVETVHVKNTGRCKELLLPNAVVYLSESDNPQRKTRFDLVAVEKTLESSHGDKKIIVNLDSQAPNKVAAHWIENNRRDYPEIIKLKSEYTLGKSRFDFFLEYRDARGQIRQQLVEVKGCTLEKDGVAMFPDAPTLRGLKHVSEITRFRQNGEYEGLILIIVQMEGCRYFTPNRETHPEFAQALEDASNSGVKVTAVECSVTPSSLTPKSEIPCILTMDASSTV